MQLSERKSSIEWSGPVDDIRLFKTFSIIVQWLHPNWDLLVDFVDVTNGIERGVGKGWDCGNGRLSFRRVASTSRFYIRQKPNGEFPWSQSMNLKSKSTQVAVKTPQDQSTTNHRIVPLGNSLH